MSEKKPKNPVKEAEKPKNKYSYGIRVKPAILRNRVIRGGSWDGGAMYARVADRSGNFPVSRNYDCGFRLARTVKK